jgi:KDO2-lipid IV(A) lauroyltransferase
MSSHAGIGYRTLTMLARFLPRSFSYLIGETLAGSFYLLSRARRRLIIQNLKAALGEDREGLFRTGCSVMLNFGRNVVEVFMLPQLSRDALVAMVDVRGIERIDHVLTSGRGVILATAHLGSWEVGGAALAARGYSITTVAGIQFNPSLSPHVKKVKQDLGIDVVSSRIGLRRLIEALNRHEIVALHIDGDQFAGGIEVGFFGHRAKLAGGLAALALKTGSAILPAFAIRTGRSKIAVFIEQEIPTGDGDQEAITERIVAVVEAYIKRYPDQWCIFRRLWEDRA